MGICYEDVGELSKVFPGAGLPGPIGLSLRSGDTEGKLPAMLFSETSPSGDMLGLPEVLWA